MANNPIDDALDIMPVTQTDKDTSKSDIAIIPHEDELVKDLETVRTNISKVIETGSEAMEEMLALASTAEDTKAYDTVATLMIATLRANRDLMDYQRSRKNLLDHGKTPDKDAKVTATEPGKGPAPIISAADIVEAYLETKEKEEKTIDHE